MAVIESRHICIVDCTNPDYISGEVQHAISAFETDGFEIVSTVPIQSRGDTIGIVISGKKRQS